MILEQGCLISPRNESQNGENPGFLRSDWPKMGKFQDFSQIILFQYILARRDD